MEADVPPIEEPLAELERRLIDEYIRRAGHDPDVLRARGDAAARKLLVEASIYAATKLTEVESRAHYVRDLHGQG
jgi:regulator of protease activity HflC (stomatin/prohibitin superfamily)